MGKRDKLKSEILGLIKELQSKLASARGPGREPLEALDERAKQMYQHSQAATNEREFLDRLDKLRDELRLGLYPHDERARRPS